MLPGPPTPSGLERAQQVFQTGDAASARAALEAAIAGERIGAPPLVLLGYLHLSDGGAEAAADLARRALARDPLCPDAHLLEGLIAREQGKHDEATAAFKRALYLEPASALARYQLGSALRSPRSAAAGSA